MEGHFLCTPGRDHDGLAPAQALEALPVDGGSQITVAFQVGGLWLVQDQPVAHQHFLVDAGDAVGDEHQADAPPAPVASTPEEERLQVPQGVPVERAARRLLGQPHLCFL